VLSGRGLCNGLITRPEEFYRLWHVVVCDQETSKMRRLKPATRMWKIQPQWVVTPGKQTNKKLNLIVTNMEFCKVKKILWIEKSQIYTWPAHKKWHLMQKCLLYLIKWCHKPAAKYSKSFYTRHWKCHSPRLLHKQHLCNIDESTFSNNPGIVCTTWNTPTILAISSSAFFIGSHC
jgi:hypothetical protein